MKLRYLYLAIGVLCNASSVEETPNVKAFVEIPHATISVFSLKLSPHDTKEALQIHLLLNINILVS